MKVQLERTFPIPASPEATWNVLADVESVAGCMPGAAITERIDESHYKGTVTLKVGPATLKFRGDIEVCSKDAASRTLHLIAKGTDTTGSSTASLDLTARVEAAANGASNLIGRSAASVNGKAATFGGRMMDSVADQILRQFAANFAARVGAQPSALVAGAPQVPPGAPLAAAPGASAPPPAPVPLNAFALLWGVIKDWWRGLFSRKAA